MSRFASVVAVLVALAAGCDECPAGTALCVGDDVLRSCWSGVEYPSGARWSEKKCPVACREAGGKAMCVSTPDPVPECDSGGEICYQNTIASCQGGYPIFGKPCSDDSVCVTAGSCGPMCAVSDIPDPRCAATPFCDADGNLWHCLCGFATDARSCGTANHCQTFGGDSQCTESSAPDPRCGDPALERSGFCSGNDAISCWFGFVIERRSCARCVVASGRSGCAS